MTQFRSLNSAGIEAFRNYLQRLRMEATLPPPRHLLIDDAFSAPLIPSIEGKPERFGSRMAFARWLSGTADRSGHAIPRSDSGFWAWLSLELFDEVCPQNASGKRKPGADARHIPESSNWRRRYRHLLANPYDVFLLHRDDPTRAMAALVNPLSKPGELTEQFTARVELVSCPGTMALASHLFIDAHTGVRKHGASGDAARRFGKLMNQFARTWDLPLTSAPKFAELLPKEFERFRESASR
ncbi:MAG: hypothetical protein M3Q42_10145 [Pseudomonadota bacterium]|nr:hypothetical protein [Pseudomonadota bacterium]